MKKVKKSLAILIAAIMVLSVSPFGFADGSTAADIDYIIDNPYKAVKWETDGQYKADLHCHTVFSDGNDTLPESVERHYELGFDILAITDHGTVSRSYVDQKFNAPMAVFSYIENGELKPDVLEINGTAANGNKYSVEINSTTGDEYYSQETENAQKMLRVPFGNEQNPTSFNNAHVNTWFVDYGDGRVGGTSNYEDIISKIDQLGGTSVINHPGEYTNARDEVFTADAYNVDDPVYNYKINKFANLLKKYHSCIGIDINSKGDSRTRFDRKLWDILLQKIIPTGRNVFAIATSDAHNLDIVDSGYSVMVMPELTSAALEKAMNNGAFFAASKYIGNLDELIGYSATLLASENPEAVAFGNVLKGYADKINKEIEENGEQDTKFRVEDENRAIPAPKVTNIVVDEAEDTITFTTENALLVHWIADGKVIASGNSIDLDDYSDKIGSYVRAEILGEGGIMYSQAFVLDYDGAPEAEDDGAFFDFGILVSLICDTPVKLLVALLKTPILAFVEIFN